MLDEPWANHFAKVFEPRRVPNAALRPIIDEYYTLWQDYIRHEQSNSAIHDDLHPANLLFSSGKLTGIVDFGDANAGSIESELRCLYITGDIVLRSAIDRYQQLSGSQVDYDHIRVWAIMHELSRFTSRLLGQQTNDATFLRAQQNLRSWIPNFPL